MAPGMSEAVGDELAALVRVRRQHRAGPADEAGGGLVAGAGDHVDVGEDLVAGEPADRPRLVLELGLQQLRHDVVGRVLGPPVDVLLEHLAGDEVRGDLHRLSRLGAQGRVDVVADGLLVALGDPEQQADGAHRHLRAELGDEVEAACADERVEATGAELADLALQLVHPPRREGTRQQSAVDGVGRGVLEDEDARGHLDPRLDQLEDGAPSRDVGRGVEQAPLHVLEAAQGVEVVRLVVIEGRLLAQPAEHRVRVGVDADVVRVEVDVVGAGRRHGASPGTIDVSNMTPIVAGVNGRGGRRSGPGGTRDAASGNALLIC